MTDRRWLTRILVPVLLALAAVLAPVSVASAASGLEQITRYAVGMTLARDGSMRVKETITYDFGSSTGKHGIYREIHTDFSYDADRDRIYEISDVRVSSPTGAPADTKVSGGAVTSIRVGDPNRTVTGTQTYVIEYTLKGVINSFGDHQELYWNAIGDEWSVSITHATATVAGPGPVTKAACYAGAQGSTLTCAHTVVGGKASFSSPELQPAQGMTVVAAFPPNTFVGAKPILRERQTLRRAFSLTPLTGVGSLALLAVLGGGAMALVSRRGRDEKYLGVTPGLEPGTGMDASVARVGTFRRDPVAVQFTPPADMRPGELGTLIDEQANVVDVTATIVDLAVRGFLRIEEISGEGLFHRDDWRLVMIWPAPVEQLRDYELTLLRAVFDDRQEVLLSELKQTFRADLQRVQRMLYDEVTRRGWFRGNPSSVRTRWSFYGAALTLAGGGLTWLLATRTRYGLIGLAVAVSGLVLLVLAPRMPARTARGTAALAQAKGFRRYLETAEANQIRFEEGQDIFSRYLPFAIVFGVAERWAKVFADLAASGVRLDVPTWYVGSYYAAGLFDYSGFGRSMDGFATTTSGSIAAATPSSSGSSGFGGGGFSGGGGGGGGGGSW